MYLQIKIRSSKVYSINIESESRHWYFGIGKVHFTSKLIMMIKDKLSNTNPNTKFLCNNYGTTNI